MRQLTDAAGLVTLSRSYEPYGQVAESSGVGETMFSYTREWRGGYTDLLYLRARFYDLDGKFLTQDIWPGQLKRPISNNSWLYSNSNPINFVDPRGMFSIHQIAESYGVSTSDLLIGLNYGGFASRNEGSGLKDRWGWLKLLLDAKEGQSVYVGNPALFPPYLNVTNSETIRLHNGTIMIGSKSLRSYTSSELNNPMGPFFWRNMKPNHYYLNSQEYLDKNTRGDLPDFRIVNIDALSFIPGIGVVIGELLDAGGSVVIDRYGNIYLSGYGSLAPNIGGQPISIGEGYVSRFPYDIYTQVMTNSRINIPSEEEVIASITGWCGNVSGNILTGSVQVTLCKNYATIVTYGYGLGLLGDAAGFSYSGESPIIKVPELAWNYIDEKSGISEVDARREIERQFLIDPCK